MRGLIAVLALVAFAAVASAQYECDLTIVLGDTFKERDAPPVLKLDFSTEDLIHTKVVKKMNGPLKHKGKLDLRVDLEAPLSEISTITLKWRNEKGFLKNLFNNKEEPIQVEAIIATDKKNNISKKFCGVQMVGVRLTNPILLEDPGTTSPIDAGYLTFMEPKAIGPRAEDRLRNRQFCTY